MLEIEGYDLNFVDTQLKAWKALHFKKAELIFKVDKEGDKITTFFTSEMTDEFPRSINLIDVDLKIKKNDKRTNKR